MKSCDRQEVPIFELIRDTRSIRTRLWTLAGALALDTLLFAALAVSLALSAARHAAERLKDHLRAELTNYRIVLIEPDADAPPGPPADVGGPPAPRAAMPARERAPSRTRPPTPAPGQVLDRMDPRLSDFVRQNPSLEKILTREIVRDVGRNTLDLRTALRNTHIDVRFEVDGEGKISRLRLERSSRIESIDRLALELVMLLEKYQILAPLRGLERVTVSFVIEGEVAIRLEAEATDSTAAEEIRKQVQNLFGLLRFGLSKEEAALFLDGIVVQTAGSRVRVGKAFGRQLLADFLLEVYGAPQTPPPAAAQKPRP